MNLNWGGGYTKSEVDTLLTGKADSSHTHTKSQITDFPSLATVATSGSYNDLSNKPTIPTVNNATLTIQKNGTTVKTFTANASSDVTCNITVPTKTSDLTNDSGFLTSHQDLSGYVPLSGTNALSGSIVPDTDNSVDIGSSAKNIKAVYSKNIYISGSGNGLKMNNSSDSMHIGISSGAAIDLCGKDYTYKNNQGKFILTAFDGNTYVPLAGSSSGTLTWGSKNLAMQEDVVPRSGGAVITGDVLARNVDDASLYLCGSASFNTSSAICVYGNDFSVYNLYGVVRIFVRNTNLSQTHEMQIRPSGSWTWTGQAVQITSDQRLKQQINEIDDKLLDAWEDVTLCQFKYNDAVEQKGNQARLHTGYVVQQIDNACKSHNVDISEYGLYCHEEYPEETREVEHEDGTKTIEVVRPASEHYSLRYTETLVVECAYLRKKNKELENTVLNLQTEIADLKSVIAELKTTVQGNQKS